MGLIRIILIAGIALVLFISITARAQELYRAQAFPSNAPVVVSDPTVEATGVLISQVQGGVAIPYILYEVNGVIWTRALAFDALSDCGGISCADSVRAYGDTPIEVQGILASEHILVRVLDPAGGNRFTFAVQQ